MDCEQLVLFSTAIQAWLKKFDQKLASTTVSQYVAACDRMNRLNFSPIEMGATSKRSFYLYRGALIYCTITKIRTIHRLAQFAIDHGECNAAYAQVLKIKELLKILMEYQPDPARRNKHKSEPGEWVKWARKNSIRAKSQSKRKVLPYLPPDWRQLMWDHVPKRGKYRAPIAVLACVGVRPSEIHRGVSVECAPDGGLQFTILGTKTHGGKYGQAQRVITVSVDSPEAKFLENKLSTTGSPLMVTCNPALLKDAVVYVSKKTWPNAKDHVTPYVYRHQVSADLKDDGLADEQVSEVLGHAAAETQRYYGQRRQGRRGGTRVLGVKASRSVKARRRIYRGPTSGGPKRGSP